MLSGNIKFLLYLSLLLGILGLSAGAFAHWQLAKFNKLRKSFFAGKTGADLEGLLLSLSGQMKNLQQEQLIFHRHLDDLERVLGFAVQKVGLVKFNPFADAGGKFSFVLALLDAHNTGAVITSMHGREQNRIYVKGVLRGKSDIQLSEEEQKAIAMANSKSQIIVPAADLP